MNKISSIAQSGRSGKAIVDRPNDDLVMALAAPKGPSVGRKSSPQDARENQPTSKDDVVLGELSSGEHSIDLGTESASSLPALFDAPAESFVTLAQAPAAKVTSDGRPAAVFFESASATQIGAIALGVIAVGAAAASGGSDSPKVVPAPTVATGAAGVISVTLGGDATTAKLFQGTTDITSKFTSVKEGQVVKFTPVPGQVEIKAQPITAKAADSAGLSSVDSTSVSYTFDNIAPLAPTVSTAAAGVITVALAATSDATTVKVIADKTEVTSNFKADIAPSGLTVTFTPIAGKVDLDTQLLTATAADAAKNVSAASAVATYKFDNIPPAAAPTAVQVVDTETGVITMSVGADATTAKLFAGTTDITSNFNSKSAGTSLTFTPLAGKVEYEAQAIDVKASDAAGNLSAASTKQTYTFDNVAPPAPSSVVPDSKNGNVKVSIGNIGKPEATTVKLFAGGSDITGNYDPDTSVAGSVTFVPVAGKVGYTNQALTATVADAAGNVSLASSPSDAYTFLNSIKITADSASKAPSSGIPASAANYLFTVDTSTTYGATVTGFGVGDLIAFKGDSAPAPNFKNNDLADNRVTISATAGSNAVELTLTNLPSGADQQLFGVQDFIRFFGKDSISFTSNTIAGPSSALTIGKGNSSGPAGKGFDAAGSNVAYTVSEETFASTIANFDKGDSIAFVSKGAAATLNFGNPNLSDGSVLITGTFGSGEIAQLTVKVPPTLDAQIFGKDDFVSLFGSGSLASVGQAGSKAVDVTPNFNGGPGGFNASTGEFAYNIGTGEYKTTINGFGSGDSLSFFGSKVATLGIKNTNFTDGVVLVTGLVDGQLVEVTLGVAANLDSKVFGVNSFNETLGAGSLIA